MAPVRGRREGNSAKSGKSKDENESATKSVADLNDLRNQTPAGRPARTSRNPAPNYTDGVRKIAKDDWITVVHSGRVEKRAPDLPILKSQKKLTRNRKDIIANFLRADLSQRGHCGTVGSDGWIQALLNQMGQPSERGAVIADPITTSDIRRWLNNPEFTEIMMQLKKKESSSSANAGTSIDHLEQLATSSTPTAVVHKSMWKASSSLPSGSSSTFIDVVALISSDKKDENVLLAETPLPTLTLPASAVSGTNDNYQTQGTTLQAAVQRTLEDADSQSVLIGDGPTVGTAPLPFRTYGEGASSNQQQTSNNQAEAGPMGQASGSVNIHAGPGAQQTTGNFETDQNTDTVQALLEGFNMSENYCQEPIVETGSLNPQAGCSSPPMVGAMQNMSNGTSTTAIQACDEFTNMAANQNIPGSAYPPPGPSSGTMMDTLENGQNVDSAQQPYFEVINVIGGNQGQIEVGQVFQLQGHQETQFQESSITGLQCYFEIARLLRTQLNGVNSPISSLELTNHLDAVVTILEHEIRQRSEDQQQPPNANDNYNHSTF